MPFSKSVQFGILSLFSLFFSVGLNVSVLLYSRLKLL